MDKIQLPTRLLYYIDGPGSVDGASLLVACPNSLSLVLWGNNLNFGFFVDLHKGLILEHSFSSIDSSRIKVEQFPGRFTRRYSCSHYKLC